MRAPGPLVKVDSAIGDLSVTPVALTWGSRNNYRCSEMVKTMDARTLLPRILVVDDDPPVCQLLTRYLAQQGFLVDSAVSGAELRRHMATGAV